MYIVNVTVAQVWQIFFIKNKAKFFVATFT